MTQGNPTETAMSAPNLLRHLRRNGVVVSIDDDGGLLIEGASAKQMMPLIHGRGYELVCLLSSRADWLRAENMNGPQQ